VKIAVIGGGSTYTPELVDGFARVGSMVSELVLIDPAAERLAVVGAFAQRIFKHHGHPGRVWWTTDLDAGVTDADAAVIQLRVGGQTARISDETFPLVCGCVGQETTGAGGLAKALRTVPVILDVADRIRARAKPGAWIVDFTNPVGIVTRALLDAGHQAVGLCNVAIGFQRRFAGFLGVEPSAVVLDHVGLNHLTWERAAYVDGVDRLPGLLADHLVELAEEVESAPEVLTTLGCVPSYYLNYFYNHDKVVREERGQPTRGQRVAEIEATLLEMYRLRRGERALGQRAQQRPVAVPAGPGRHRGVGPRRQERPGAAAGHPARARTGRPHHPRLGVRGTGRRRRPARRAPTGLPRAARPPADRPARVRRRARRRAHRDGSSAPGLG
jgi:6-phospho-beta-glucosidase